MELLSNIRTIAFIMSPRLGDSLISMVISHNLRLHGFQVTSFNDYLAAIAEFFPEEDIRPYPAAAIGREVLSGYDLLIYMEDSNILFDSQKWHPRLVILDHYPLYKQRISLVDTQALICQQIFGLPHAVRTNGLRAPADLSFRKHLRRVAIHASASSQDKQWPKQRFIRLAQELQKQNYEPVFILSAAERPQFSWIFEQGFTALADPDIHSLPKFLYESGWFIGNDSGIGHLASNLGIPTLTLIERQGICKRWRPSWAPGEVLLPWMPLLLRAWKNRYWKYFISVPRVMRTFNRLTRSVNHG